MRTGSLALVEFINSNVVIMYGNLWIAEEFLINKTIVNSKGQIEIIESKKIISEPICYDFLSDNLKIKLKKYKNFDTWFESFSKNAFSPNRIPNQ